MKYFFDTEFIECWRKPIKWLPTINNFNKPYHSIQLISIGIVCEEDGSTYYAVSNEFNPNDANEWVVENVIPKLPDRWRVIGDNLDGSLIKSDLWKSNKQIADEVLAYIRAGKSTPEFYAYYADYDWVLFCSLFGSMMDLPKGFPMYCKDLKQMLDDTAANLTDEGFMRSVTFDNKLNYIKSLPGYPKQVNEHNALADAKWGLRLYKFLKAV